VNDETYRLPRAVLPRRYDLTITPDLGAATFAGEERVDVQVVEASDAIVLNAAELEIDRAEVQLADGSVLAARVSLDEKEERATLALDREIPMGEAVVVRAFRGVLNDKLHGFYRSTFRDADGVDHVIATTQFEATHARRAFPCWDEPDFKARFAVTLVVPEDLTAVSNGGVVKEEPTGDGHRRVTFAETMVMSTYLVAFVVGPFVATDPVDVDGVPLRVITPPGKLELSTFALEIGAASLRFFGNYFDLPYPSDKLDLIAIPDFAFGAMENLGAVTFRETALLVDRDHASRLELERVAQVVAHEIAHMWFGDLVTMKWWNGIWLNEAFATFMELLCVDDFRPQWETWIGFGVSRAQALAVDGLSSTRPVEFPVGRPEEADAMFDVLTYQKGCAVLRMLEQHLGPDSFRDGIVRYLDEHKHANTETTDLWDAIEAESGRPARSIMDSWIFQPGYPLISVEVEGGDVRLYQRRFLYLDTGDEDSTLWRVPLTLRAAVGGAVIESQELLTEGETTVAFAGAPAWVVANADAAGFYRVRYAPELLAKLTARPQGLLAPLERFNIVSDTWAATLAGHDEVAAFTGVARRFEDEADPDVWTVLLAPMRLFDRVIADGERPVLARFVHRMVLERFTQLGWERAEGESERTGQLRAQLVVTLGTLGNDDGVVARCRTLHEEYLEDRTAVDADLIDAVVAVVAENGDAADYERFLARYRDPATPQDEMRYLYALGRFPDPALMQRTLDLCLSEVRTQNAPYLIGQMLAGRHSGPPAWRFVVEHWDVLCERFPSNAIPRMVEGLAGQADAALAAEAHQFFADHPVPLGELQVRQTLERLDVNVAFAGREAGRLADALE
jgi:puromycin-sensitive aminopeptidase